MLFQHQGAVVARTRPELTADVRVRVLLRAQGRSPPAVPDMDRTAFALCPGRLTSSAADRGPNSTGNFACPSEPAQQPVSWP